ncbi:ATP-dependent acyl-CoA ligase [Alkalihalobacterium alkalinitrilicum]|uniref:ATP-dependent acyl-CoA ligase n=1 Tax=Alkalihalobacterium alkalinitrilicum TaxID=427920 RepID=UPI001303E955|nr:ATP-dependent acyl-CoA ligase [Alkalihalobacterium alkalinitrilicum]
MVDENNQLNHIVDALTHQAIRKPNQVYVKFKNESFTYQQVDERSAQIAHVLSAQGFKKGSHVALLLKNHTDFIFIWFALAKLGAVMVPVNTHIKGDSLKHILNHSDSLLLIYDTEFEENIDKIKCELSREMMIRNKSSIIEASFAHSKIFKPVSLVQSDPMSIIYTSGTTGLPKGVVLSHYTYINTALKFVNEYGKINEDDILYTCLPLFHCNAQQLSAMGALIKGAQLVLSERFSASNFWNEVKENKATVFNYIGSMLTILYKQEQGDSDRDHSVTKVFGGAAPKEIWEEFEKRFNIKILEGYGLSEVATVSMCNTMSEQKIGSVGKPLSHLDVKIVDLNRNELPPYTDGEIVIRAKQESTIFSGYYKMPDKTDHVVENNWFYTGDRGSMDEEGFFYFKDRLKDCIRYRGENISSYEIEKIINKYPDVIESAAIGVPSELSEEDVKVYLVLKPNIDQGLFDLEKFIRYCEQNMAFYMIPRYIELRKDLPKTATERVQKYELRKDGIGSAWDRVKSNIKIQK